MLSDTNLEEGELEQDDTDEPYTPLERPHFPVQGCTTNHVQPSESEEDAGDSSSDSDSSIKRSCVKLRRKSFTKQIQNVIKPKKNYNIWCNDLQADILTDSLVSCNVDKNERARDVESYNYKLGVSNNTNNKYSHNSSKSNQKYAGKRKHNRACLDDSIRDRNSSKNNNGKTVGNTRTILELSTSILNSESEIATDISNKLFEEKEDLILRAVNILGKESVILLFEETKNIEASGGMLIMNGKRRKTPGGVFFYLMKTSGRFSRELINKVFAEDKKLTIKSRKIIANNVKKERAAKFKEALHKDDFPTLLSSTKLAMEEFKAKQSVEVTSEVTNPPPSPATD